MILTEREKWLMGRAWDTSLTYCGTMEHWLKGRTESGMSIMHDHLAEYAPESESIVKVVDPDNLPVESVLSYELVWNEFRLGHLYTSKAGGVYCDPDFGDAPKLYEVTHYIEKKDLIKLFEDAK